MLRSPILFLHMFVSGWCFNLDVDHPVIIANPNDLQKKSYFGYSVVLYSDGEQGEKWLKIGAPKASYEHKQKIENSGLVFHCPYMEICQVQNNLKYNSMDNFDETANLTGAWTGGSMDISYKYKTLAISASNWKYFIRHGRKYSPSIRGGIFLQNVQTRSMQSRSPLKEPLVKNNLSYYARTQTGFSIHFLQDQNELLIGAPGVNNFLGTVLKLKNIEKTAAEWKYEVMAPKGNYYEYSGYAVTSGRFYKKNELNYVTGLPRGHKNLNPATGITYGAVIIFRFSDEKLKIKNQYKTVSKGVFYGTQFGEYFGASLAAGDMNGDKLDDLIVGAPFRTNDKTGFNHGSVYVIFANKKKLERIDGTISSGLFGMAVMFLGDLDKDGRGDFAVSAPRQDTSGVVYIYTYDKLTKTFLVSQTLFGKNIFPDLRGFGMSFSRPKDIDDNHFSDILVGSPISGHAVLLRAKPMVMVHKSMQVPSNISKSSQTFTFKCCYSYDDYPEANLTIIRTLTVDGEQQPNRFIFEQPDKISEEGEITMERNKVFCEEKRVFKLQGVTNYNDSISITLSYRIPDNVTADSKNPIFISNYSTPIEKDTFCKKCPLISPRASKSETKLVMWDHLCAGKICKSELVVEAKFINLSKENTFVLGSLDHLTLQVTVLNKKDPAFTPLLEIYLPNGVLLRRGPLNCGNTEIGKISCDLGEELLNEVTYSYELNIDEGLSESELNFFINSSTTTLSNDDKSVLNITLILEKEADFEVTGESKESSYIYIKEETTLIQNVFKVEKMGPSPMPEIEVDIMIPYKLQDSKGIYRKFAEIQEYQDNIGNQLPKCQNITDYDISSSLKRLRRGVNLTHSEGPISPINKTYPMIDPAKIFYINCTMENVKCAIMKCLVGPFDNVQKYAEVAVEMKLNFKHLEDLLTQKETILITSGANLSIENFIQIGNRSDFTEISNLLIIQKEYRISMWILIGSAIAGLLILILLTIGLAKAGFFERKDQKKLRQLKEEALEEERLLGEMIAEELAKGTIIEEEENSLYNIVRYRKPAEELSEENELYGALLVEK